MAVADKDAKGKAPALQDALGVFESSGMLGQLRALPWQYDQSGQNAIIRSANLLDDRAALLTVEVIVNRLSELGHIHHPTGNTIKSAGAIQSVTLSVEDLKKLGVAEKNILPFGEAVVLGTDLEGGDTKAMLGKIGHHHH